MKIRLLCEDDSAPLVEVTSGNSEESEGMKNAKSVGDSESAVAPSVDAPPPVADSGTGGASAPADGSTPLAPDPAADDTQLDDASALDGTSEIDDTSETTLDVSGPDDRLLLSTPFDTYTVTEGLLLLAVIFIALGGAISLFRGR